MRPTIRRLVPLAALLTGVAVLATLSASNAATTPQPDRRAPAAQGPPGFAKVVFLSHVNDPATTPGFPGDPAFRLSTPFTVPEDGFYLQYVKEDDEEFQESSLVLHRHRLTLENLTGLGQLPPAGAWVVVGGPRNHNGSGSPATIYALVP